MLLSHADRSRIAEAGIGRHLYQQHGHWSPLLVDGFLRGTWKIARGRDAATLVIELAGPLSRAARAAVSEEGAALLELMAAEAAARDIRFVD